MSDSEFSPTTQGELARYLRDNAAGPKHPIIPAGGRTALQTPRAADVSAVVVGMGRLTQVLDYPARDMTVTVEAGIKVDDLAALLRQERQQLPIDIPQSSRATLGGAIACNVSGSRRYGYGTFRDYLIGVSAVDGTGRPFSAGGRVVKNVAGYDLCKLLIGSLGTLGVISQVTLKLKPIPETSGLLWATYDMFAEIDDVLARLLKSDARPVQLDVLSPSAAAQIASECRRPLPTDRPALLVGVEGSEKDVAWQLGALTRELAPLGPDDLFALNDAEAGPIRTALTEFSTESDAPLSFKASLPPSAVADFAAMAVQAGVSVLAHAGNGILHGHFPDEAGTFERTIKILTPMKEWLRTRRGHLTFSRLPAEWTEGLSSPATGPEWELMGRLRAAFDPHQLLNPGLTLHGA
ncbi:MAG: FAD-binding oxidoreductase [Planctomycetaceae bacterium]|nr:FAD-binding oxidoreductase [Planctomycetaceae bacterium]